MGRLDAGARTSSVQGIPVAVHGSQNHSESIAREAACLILSLTLFVLSRCRPGMGPSRCLGFVMRRTTGCKRWLIVPRSDGN